MRQSIITAISSAASLLLLTSTVTAQTTATGTGLKPVTTLGCYKSYDPLTEFGEYAFATDGWCQEACGLNSSSPVMGLVGGSTCYCGSELPPLDQQVSISNCNTPCNGYGTKNCGGVGYWQIYLTGLTTNVQTAPNTTTSSSSTTSGSTSTTSQSPSVVTKAGETVIVTAPASLSTQSSTPQDAGPNKVGIAVGVVVGILVVAAIVGGLLFLLKQRRKRAIEEEHKRNAAMNDFVAGKKSETSSADARLDPVIFSHRRESIGSIADEMDYSRRILQVRNPDHRSSQQSNLVPT